MELPQHKSIQFELPCVEPRGRVADDGVPPGRPGGRSPSEAQRAQALIRGQPVCSAVSMLPRLVRPEGPGASGLPYRLAAAAAGKEESESRLERIQPECIRPNKYLTREKSHWDGEAFAAFREDIRNAGGNVQPIKIRPIAGEGQISYEIVFGHRRHRACLELGLTVNAVVEELGDLALFAQMVRENTGQHESSVFARGLQFMLALDSGLIEPSQNWEELFGVGESMVHKLVKLARLPSEVVAAFDCPSHLKTRWGPALTGAVKKDREGLLKRVAEVATWSAPRNPKLVFEYLTRSPHSASAAAGQEVHLRRAGRNVATLSIPHAAVGDGIRVQFVAGAVDLKLLVDDLRHLLNIDEAGVTYTPPTMAGTQPCRRS